MRVDVGIMQFDVVYPRDEGASVDQPLKWRAL